MTMIQSTTESTAQITTEKIVWTDEAFMALSGDGHRYEIVNSELIDMGNSGALYGYICILLSSALISHVLTNKLGVILDSSTAFKMKSGNKRSPDISFFAKERLGGISHLPSGFLTGAPDLAVEVLSPTNNIEEIDGKISEYFENGTKLIWVISPTQHYILVYRCAAEPDRLLKSVDFLDGEEVISGFSYAIANLFQPLSF